MQKIYKIRKRDGRTVDFEQEKITNAIHRAISASGKKDGKLAQKLSDEAVKILEKRFVKAIPSVEDVQDIVIEVFGKKGYKKIAKEYAEYRKRKEEIRKTKKALGIEPEIKLPVNSLIVLQKRYLLRDENGKIIETPAQMFKRVARAIASVEIKDTKKIEKEFYNMMSRLLFLPNSPTLFNAGTKTGFGLSACYVLPVPDSLEGIFDAVKNMALIEQGGGGVGFSFSNLRPKGDIVRSTKGVSSGPVSFMRVFDTVTDVIKAGGKRRGAMMGILRVDHPDILEFITAKSKPGFLSNFNISVAVTNAFLDAAKKNKKYNLINPRTEKAVKKLKARAVWNLITENAWKTGDPGVIFIDEVNKRNPTPQIGQIEGSNPCSEFLGLPFESCNLGSINLSEMVKEKNGKTEIDWEKLRKTVRIAVQFLDDVIDANVFPLKEIEEITKANRKIGLGIMSWADLLIKLKIPYDSKKALALAEKVMKFISEVARKKSMELGKQKGSFPNFEKSVWKKKYKSMRNASLTILAPTGSLSIIAGVSSGIEPLFAISFIRNVLEGANLLEVNPLFEKTAKEIEFYSGKLLEEIAKTGSIQKIKGIPKYVKKIFKTALDIKPEWHIRMQAAFQKYTDLGISKTINLPANATKKDVKKAFELAYKLKCKGTTVYRYGSKPTQVLYVGGKKEAKHITAEAEYAGGCPTKTCTSPS